MSGKGGGFYAGKGSGGGGFYAGKDAGQGKGSDKGSGKSSSAADQGPPISSAVIRKLEALGYPEVGSVSLTGQNYCKCVLWLEEEKIRYLEKQDRKPLREFNRAWYEKVEEYCAELGVPADDLTEKNLPAKLRILNALVNLAIHDIYRDKAEANELDIVAPPKSMAATDEQKQTLQHLVPPLNRCLESFGLPILPSTAEDSDTIAALRCIHTRVCPSKEFSESDSLDLDKLPVGLQIDDSEVRRAAVVLRLLHGIELQQLQVNINQVVNELQGLTAEPKTDTRLGRVGR